MTKNVMLLALSVLLVAMGFMMPSEVPYIPRDGLGNGSVTFVYPGHPEYIKPGIMYITKVGPHPQETFTVPITYVKYGPGGSMGIYVSGLPPVDGLFIITKAVMGNGQEAYIPSNLQVFSFYPTYLYFPLIQGGHK